jgi:hypothetical protein
MTVGGKNKGVRMTDVVLLSGLERTIKWHVVHLNLGSRVIPQPELKVKASRPLSSVAKLNLKFNWE